MEFFEGILPYLKPDRKYIFIRTKKIGIHAFRDKDRVPQQVNYIYFPHRHVFHFEILLSVNDINVVDYVVLKKDIDNFLDKIFEKKTPMSCEMFGQLTIKYLRKQFVESDIFVGVSEDNENGSLTWEVK